MTGMVNPGCIQGIHAFHLAVAYRTKIDCHGLWKAVVD